MLWWTLMLWYFNGLLAATFNFDGCTLTEAFVTAMREAPKPSTLACVHE